MDVDDKPDDPKELLQMAVPVTALDVVGPPVFPPEILSTILEMVEEPQVITIKQTSGLYLTTPHPLVRRPFTDGNEVYIWCSTQPSVPVTLHVCHASRASCLNRYKILFSDVRPLYFNPVTDTIFLFNVRPCFFEDYSADFTEELSNVQNLMIFDDPEPHHPRLRIPMDSRLLPFRNLKKLTLDEFYVHPLVFHSVLDQDRADAWYRRKGRQLITGWTRMANYYAVQGLSLSAVPEIEYITDWRMFRRARIFCKSYRAPQDVPTEYRCCASCKPRHLIEEL